MKLSRRSKLVACSSLEAGWTLGLLLQWYLRKGAEAQRRKGAASPGNQADMNGRAPAPAPSRGGARGRYTGGRTTPRQRLVNSRP